MNEKFDIFNRTILNILRNFIPHEIIVCDNKDLPWFNNRIKSLIQEKNATYKIYRHNKDNPDLIYRLQFLQERLITSIESSKGRYYAKEYVKQYSKKHKNLLVLVKSLFKQ